MLALLGFVAACVAAGASGSGIIAANIHTWYLTLKPPPLTPPDFLFAPVWAVLYVMLGVAAWLVWRLADTPARRRAALVAWGIQLGLNASWAPVFFGLHLKLPALMILFALGIAIAVTIRRFRRVSGMAALLLLPYAAWAGFAAYLNAGFWWLNR